jgi:threonine dehydrogenase-like Zn-dependent dehydrogenase
MENKKMVALMYRGVRDIALEECPFPLCGPNDVIVRNVRAGICEPNR